MSTHYRPDIDGLRAIAIISVVLYHAGFGVFPGGFTGVDIFFVISGFLIASIIARQVENGEFSVLNFFERRLRRILPAFVFVLSLCCLVAFLIMTPGDLKSFGGSATASLLLHANNYFYSRVDYFAEPAIEQPLLHMWSLSIEEQFYIILPFVLLLIFRIKTSQIRMALLMTLFLASFAMSCYLANDENQAGFFLMHSRAWELLLGVIIALHAPPIKARAVGDMLGFTGLGLIVYSLIAIDKTMPFPGWNAVAPTLGTALIIISGGNRHTIVYNLLSVKPFVFVGVISYSLYLVHWPIFSFYFYYVNAPLQNSEKIILISVSVMLAMFSWRFVEQPFRNGYSARKFAFIGRGLAVSLFMLIMTVTFNKSEGLPNRFDKGMLISFDEKAKNKSYDYKIMCRHVHGVKINEEFCALGAELQKNYSFVLWGDSHARHFAGTISELASRSNISGIMSVKSSCPVLAEKILVQKKKCNDTNAATLNFILENQNIRTVFIAGRWKYFVDTEFATVTGRPAEELFSKEIAKLASMLIAAGKKVIILEQIAEYRMSVSLCAAREAMRGRSGENCTRISRNTAELQTHPANMAFRDVASKSSNAVSLSPFNALCDDKLCYASKKGIDYYRGASHLNDLGSRLLADEWPELAQIFHDIHVNRVRLGGEQHDNTP